MSAPVLRFRVVGKPAPQGSMKAFVRAGKAAITNSNAERLRPWRDAVREDAVRAAGPGWRPLTGPVRVVLLFAVPKPTSEPKRRRTWPIKMNNDLDKLTRGVLDALTDASVYLDDGQVVCTVAAKDYPGPDIGMHVPGVTIAIYRIDDATPVAPTTGQIPLLLQGIPGD